ncbi:unnamed protein product [Hyaloperonospora brassicae]|uniref:RXLR phytopathogen effector protein WY-domain domain-containing protein n=1 Tax=Hyaloperonospora brassicae TaxID=162125 RepID=A0AAV0U2R4_HYABA|nr:unnamed protein product [Hyaloperonospora brassicae]
MSYLQQLVERHPTHISKAGEDDPSYSIGELKEHIETLVRYRDVDDAHSMLRALAVRKDHAGQLISGACLDARVSSEEFFRLLPISDDLIKVGFEDPAQYQKIYDDLKQWLNYVKVIVAKQRGAAYEMAKAKGRPFVYENFDPISFFVNILMKEGKSENVWAFLEELRRIKAKPTFVQETTLQLLSNHPVVAEKMLQAWADGGLNPVHAARRMPWEQVSLFDYRAEMAPLQEFVNCKRLEQVLKYVALYRVHHTFAIGDVDWTLTKVPRANLRAYLMFLQGHQDVDAGSKELVKSLLALHEPTDSELGLTSQILSKLRAQDTPWSTAMADRPQALPNA